MQNGRDERVRSRAYELWEKEGRPEGRDKEHWSQAETESGDGADNEQSQEGSVVGTVADVPVIARKRTERQPSGSQRPLQSKKNKDGLLDAGNVTRGKNA